MANELSIPQNFGALSTHLQGHTWDDELGAGVSGGFAVVSFRGKVWRIKHAGDERDVLRTDGSNDPAASLEVILVKASHALSKNYYPSGYVEGANEQPACWSTNGIAPDASAPSRQNGVCATCQWNVFGSRTTENGKKAKACSDSKRIAVVPLGDIDNELFGGAMLLRVPAASLVDMANYGKRMGSAGYPTFAIATRIGFDTKEAYPKLTFKEIRALSDQEVAKIMELRENAQVGRILSEATENMSEAPQTANVNFEQAAPEQTAPKVQVQPAKPVTTQTVKQQPTPMQTKKPINTFASPEPEETAPHANGGANGNAESVAKIDEDLDTQLAGLLGE